MCQTVDIYVRTQMSGVNPPLGNMDTFLKDANPTSISAVPLDKITIWVSNRSGWAGFWLSRHVWTEMGENYSHRWDEGHLLGPAYVAVLFPLIR